MADPTLKDVLAALAALDKKLTRELATVRAEMATKDALADVHEAVTSVASDVIAHRAETAKAFDDLDAELTGHATLHRDLERDVATVKKKLAAPRAPTRAARRR